MRNGERHALTTRCRIGGGATFQVHLAFFNGIEATAGSDQAVGHLGLAQLEMAPQRLRNLKANIHAVTHGCSVGHIGHRHGRFAVADDHHAAGLDAL